MIPIKIETLLDGRRVEQNRIEYKEGFNPSDIVHTICAYLKNIFMDLKMQKLLCHFTIIHLMIL